MPFVCEMELWLGASPRLVELWEHWTYLKKTLNRIKWTVASSRTGLAVVAKNAHTGETKTLRGRDIAFSHDLLRDLTLLSMWAVVNPRSRVRHLAEVPSGGRVLLYDPLQAASRHMLQLWSGTDSASMYTLDASSVGFRGVLPSVQCIQ